MAALHLRLSTSFHDIILSIFVPGFLLLLLGAEMFNFHPPHFLFSLRSVVRQSCDWKPVGLIRQRRSFTKNQNRSWIFNSPRESRSRRKPNNTSFQSIVFGTSFIVPAVLVYWASRTLKMEDRVSEVKNSELKSAVVAKGVGFAKPGNATSTSDNKFEYAPLDYGYKTRLLILEPGRFDEDLRCQLKHASSLKDEPKYEALSYAWGDTERTHLITCNKNQLRIPANLYRALRRLRNEQNERVLWADTICIYSHRTATKDLGTLRFAPQFSEGFNFTLLAYRFLEPERALTILRLSPSFSYINLFTLLRADSGSFTIRSRLRF
jgi:hypothetical protein